VSVNAKKAPGRYADGQGLYLVVDPSGAKRWIWRGVVHGKRSDLGLGSVHVVSLADARTEAQHCRRRAREGGDLLAERRRHKRVVPTFKAAALELHAEHSKTFRNAKHRAQWLASLEADVFPVIGARPVHTIGSSDVLKVLTPIWTVKPETARRLKQRIKVVFDWAKASGFCSGDNPTDGLTKVLPKHKGDKQHHAALPYQGVPEFIQTLRTISDMRSSVRLAFELLIVTASRTNEVQLARWPEIDLEARTWTIPGARMKSGREHRVPLSPRAVEILEAARALSRGDGWIFPGAKADKPLSNMAFLKAVPRLTTATITPHGFRSSFRDWSAERTSIPRAVCEAALAHVVKDKTEAAYHRTDLFERRRELMDLWSQYATSTPATVITLSR
jgi:integrase